MQTSTTKFRKAREIVANIRGGSALFALNLCTDWDKDLMQKIICGLIIKDYRNACTQRLN